MVLLVLLSLQPNLKSQLKESHNKDAKTCKFRSFVKPRSETPFRVDVEGILRFGERIMCLTILKLKR
jgi:hypothetical protein